MRRILIPFLLTLLLIVACQGSRSPSDDNPTATEKAVLTAAAGESQPFVWWEAEQPTAGNFPPANQNPFAPANPQEAAILSAGQWIGMDGKYQKPPFLEYQVNVPTGGTYFFYSRKFWQHGPFRWRWDDQPWQSVGRKVYLMDETPLREFVVANWVGLGSVPLTAGKHTLRLELTQSEGAAAFDCFLLTQAAFRPRGKLQPDQRYTANLSNWFVADPQPDPFTDSPIDLRSLNESVAGENGFIRVQAEQFVHEKTGRPVKFWAINTGMDSIYMDGASQEAMARFLAKKGVNLVRLHGAIWSEDFRKIDAIALQQLSRFVGALKRQGIYTALSIYFPLWLNLDDQSGFPGYSGQHPFSLLFFNRQFQQIYYDWWRKILTTPDPATGKALRDDPAVAMVELVNEDSTLFWTFSPYENIPAPQMAILEKQFGDWLATRYGSLDRAVATWNAHNPAGMEQKIRGDDPATGRMGFPPLYELSGKRDSRRAQDTAVFLARTQEKFFREAIAFLRQQLQYKGLIYASNWVTADAQILGPLDKASNAIADFMDRHGYFGGPHTGPKASYSLSSGDTYRDQSALLFQNAEKPQEQNFDLPIMDIRYNGLPSTITEVNWVMPNRFRADFPLLAAAYGTLQGTDGFFFFVTNKHSWDTSLGKFSIASPVTMGQFPATALIYRKGLLEPGKEVVHVSLSQADLHALRGAPVTAPQNLDELRAKDIPAGQASSGDRLSSIDPLAFLTGQVNLRFTANPEPSRQLDLSGLIDRKAKTVRSSTGQLVWNYNQGWVTVNAPQVQGITGFLKQAGQVQLADVQIQSEMDYGTILLVSLDDRPLAHSRRLLLQVMSEEQNFGWQTTGSAPKTLQSTGQAPITVRQLAGEIALRRPDADGLKVTALDLNGYPVKVLSSTAKLFLQPDTLYYLIESK